MRCTHRYLGTDFPGRKDPDRRVESDSAALYLSSSPGLLPAPAGAGLYGRNRDGEPLPVSGLFRSADAVLLSAVPEAGVRVLRTRISVPDFRAFQYLRHVLQFHRVRTSAGASGSAFCQNGALCAGIYFMQEF